MNHLPSSLPTPDTRLVLGNAIYFKADWFSKFEKFATVTATFARSVDDELQVRMMRETEHMSYAATEDAQILELPYDGRPRRSGSVSIRAKNVARCSRTIW